MKTLTKNFPMNFGITLPLWTSKTHALSNFAPEPTWAKPENKPSLVDKDSLPSPVLFVIHTNMIHGYMYYSHVGNDIYTHYTSKDITKHYGKLSKLLISSEKSRCYTLMNVGTFNDNPQENTVPNWLLPRTCGTQRCHL